MPNFPVAPSPKNAFNAAQQVLGGSSPGSGGFATDQVPSQTGFGTRQGRIANNRERKVLNVDQLGKHQRFAESNTCAQSRVQD